MSEPIVLWLGPRARRLQLRRRLARFGFVLLLVLALDAAVVGIGDACAHVRLAGAPTMACVAGLPIIIDDDDGGSQ